MTRANTRVHIVNACLRQDNCHVVVTLVALRICGSAVFAEPPANVMRQC